MINIPSGHIGRSFTRMALLALMTLVLFPPGPTRSLARAAPDIPTPAPSGTFQLFLPVIGSAADAPDLIFTPDTVELEPGAAASVQVRVDPAADLRGASFELPDVQDGVTNSFEAAPDGKTGTLNIQASEASQASERAIEVHGTSGDGIKGWVGKLTVNTTTTPTAQTFFVDPINGEDSNDGSEAKPFKTLTKALSITKSGDTVSLASGVYSKAKNGEQFSTTNFLIVPSGVTITGSSQGGRSILQGANGENALLFQGDVTVKYLTMQGFTNILFAGEGKQTFSNLVLSDNGRALSVFGTAQARLVASQIKIGVFGDGLDVRDQARLTVDGGSIKGPSGNCENSRNGVSLGNSAQVTLKNGVQLVDIPGRVISMRGTSRATLTNASAIRTNLTCADTVGIDMLFGSSVSLSLTNTIVSGFGKTGINLDGLHTLVVNGGAIKSNGIGINASIPANFNGRPLITIIGVSLTSNHVGMNLESVPVKLRKSILTSNDVGIKITERKDLFFFLRPDLGMAADPGGNSISGNTITGVMFDHIGGTRTADMFAAGNTWNPFVQVADFAGHYPPGLTIDGSSAFAHGTNFILDGFANGSALTQIQF